MDMSPGSRRPGRRPAPNLWRRRCGVGSASPPGHAGSARAADRRAEPPSGARLPALPALGAFDDDLAALVADRGQLAFRQAEDLLAGVANEHASVPARLGRMGRILGL